MLIGVVCGIPGYCIPNSKKEVVDISQKISYKAKMGSLKLDSFFIQEEKKEEE